MNRRQFLQSLAAIGTALAIPSAALGKATKAQIDHAWHVLAAEPRVFYVSDGGTISSYWGLDEPTCRRLLLRLAAPPVGHASLLEYIDSHHAIADHVEFLFDCENEEAGYELDWDEWLAANTERLREDLTKWVEEDADERDWERADLSGVSGRGDALSFFREQQDTAKLFGIVIVDGAHPGSSYYAAELRTDLEEANALAEVRGVPIRFGYNESY